MWSDIQTSEDLLGFSVHASLLKEVVTNDKNLPITIGLYGDWGSGKSSVLQILKESLKDEKNSIVIYFDGWSFESFDDAKMALIQGIIHELEENETFKSKVGDDVRTLLGKLKNSINWMRLLQIGYKTAVPVIASAATGGAALLPMIVDGLSSFAKEAGKGVLDKDEIEKIVNNAINKNNENSDEKYNAVRKFRKDFEKLIEKCGVARVVVLIDDLDRCLPRHIIDSLEAIKLFLDVPHTAFVIAADEYIVTNAIKSEYKDLIEAAKEDEEKDDNERKHHQDIGTSYMEKFIQLPYRLPILSRKEVETYITLLFCQSELDDDIFKKIRTGFKEFSEKNKFDIYGWEHIAPIIPSPQKENLESIIGFVSLFSSIISNTLNGNPRLIKRFLNAYDIRSNLLKVSGLETQENRFVLLKLMLLEYKYIDLFRQLHEWTFASKGGKPEEIVICERYAAAEEGVVLQEGANGAWSNDDVKNLLTSEPKFSTVDLRELYWVSRDNLKDSMGGASMIPLRIKKIVKSLLDADTSSRRDNLCTSDVINIKGDDLTSFYDLLDGQILSYPTESNGYFAYCCCIMHNIEFAYVKFISIVSRVRPNDIPIGIANQLKDVYTKIKDQHLYDIISKKKALKEAFDSAN